MELRDEVLRDDPDDEPGRGPDPDRGTVAGWLLAVAAALPVAAAAEAARRVMAGGLDRVFTATYGGYPSPSTSTRQRFEWLISAVPVGPALLASTVGVLVVVGLRLGGREPGRWPRRIAALVGAAVVVGGLGFLAAVLDYVARPPATTPATVAFVNQYPDFVQFAPQVAEVGLTVVLSAAAAVALLRASRPAPTRAAVGAPAATPVVEEAPVGQAPVEQAPVGEAPVGEGPVGAPPVAAEPSAPARVAEPALRPAGATLPRPESDDYALYRRPQP